MIALLDIPNQSERYSHSVYIWCNGGGFFTNSRYVHNSFWHPFPYL